jgi:acetyl-CoA carboxylase carboxyltransferase component
LKAETEEEFRMLAKKNPMIEEAYSKLQVMSEDEANRMIYEARLKAQRDEYSRIQGALRQGREESRQALAEKDRALAEKDREIVESKQALVDKDREIAELRRRLQNKEN